MAPTARSPPPERDDGRQDDPDGDARSALSASRTATAAAAAGSRAGLGVAAGGRRVRRSREGIFAPDVPQPWAASPKFGWFDAGPSVDALVGPQPWFGDGKGGFVKGATTSKVSGLTAAFDFDGDRLTDATVTMDACGTGQGLIVVRNNGFGGVNRVSNRP